jgi:hypothetical protein
VVGWGIIILYTRQHIDVHATIVHNKILIIDMQFNRLAHLNFDVSVGGMLYLLFAELKNWVNHVLIAWVLEPLCLIGCTKQTQKINGIFHKN